MASENKNSLAADVQTGTMEDVESVMKKYDRESNVRIWEGAPRLMIRFLCAAFSVYCIYVTMFSTMMPEERLNLFLGLMLIIGYLNYPVSKKHVRPNHIPWYDVVIMVVGAIPFFYYAANAHQIITMASRVTRDPVMVAMAVVGILAYMELCRRCVGIPILCVVGALLVYAFSHVRFGKVIYDLFYATTGIMSTPINVCAKYIVVFIIFGAFLERTGISAFFIDLANSVAGASAGGPAKVAVLSSALCGMVSGSSVGNTVTTGSVTIPMMKRTGYKAEFAGAVEAAASTGGQIMPPIMGAAAFLMSEYMGIPYGQVALRAILPAVLYFAGIYIAVHLEAKKLGLRGIPREELPRLMSLLPRIYLLLPLVVLVWLVATNKHTMQFSAAVAIGVTILVGLYNNLVTVATKSRDKSANLTFSKFIDALEAGSKSAITVAVACAMAGLVAGSITSTGLASKLITAVVTVSGGRVMIALLLTMLCCIILGMGVPTTANYCIMASTCAPILIAIGVPQVAAHFFVFYFGIVADITPPVALAAYAGSAIAKAPPMKTAFNASKLAIAAFIVPYMFAMNPAMVLVDTTPGEVLLISITSLVGMFGLGMGLEGFLRYRLSVVERLLAAAGGLCLIYPGAFTDVIGVCAVAAVIIFQLLRSRSERYPSPRANVQAGADVAPDMFVRCGDGFVNLRVGAIIMREGRFLMVGNERNDYLYSVGGRIKFGETAEEAVRREVLEETGVELEIDRLGFVHENYFMGDAPYSRGKPIYEMSWYFFMKTPEDFAPVSESFAEGKGRERLVWVSPDEDRKYFPAFFRTELASADTEVKHIITDDRY